MRAARSGGLLHGGRPVQVAFAMTTPKDGGDATTLRMYTKAHEGLVSSTCQMVEADVLEHQRIAKGASACAVQMRARAMLAPQLLLPPLLLPPLLLPSLLLLTDVLADVPHWNKLGFDQSAAPMVLWSQPGTRANADAANPHYTYEDLIQVRVCNEAWCVTLVSGNQETWYQELPDAEYDAEGNSIDNCKMGQQAKHCQGEMVVVDGNHRSDTSKSHCYCPLLPLM